MDRSDEITFAKLERIEKLLDQIIARLDEVELVRVYDLIEGPEYDPSQIGTPPTKDKIVYVKHP